MAVVKDHAYNTIQIHSIQFSGKYLYRIQLILYANIIYHSFTFDNLGEKIFLLLFI